MHLCFTKDIITEINSNEQGTTSKSAFLKNLYLLHTYICLVFSRKICVSDFTAYPNGPISVILSIQWWADFKKNLWDCRTVILVIRFWFKTCNIYYAPLTHSLTEKNTAEDIQQFDSIAKYLFNSYCLNFQFYIS